MSRGMHSVVTVLAVACAPSAEVADFTETPPQELAHCSRSSAEICNGRDDDCDGAVDENDACTNRCGAAQLSGSCALRNDGTLWCWGMTGGGRVTLVRRDRGEGPFVEVGGPGVTALCARRVDGGVWCSAGWVTDTPAPQAASDGIVRVKALGFDVAGLSDQCAVKTDGSVWCWGSNVGDGTSAYRTDPRLVRLPAPAARVMGSEAGRCARLVTGETWCWGRAAHVLLLPERLQGFDDVPELVAADTQRCGIGADGWVVCAGSNEHGQLCDGTLTTSAEGKRARNLGQGVLALAVSGTETCGLKADGVWCCGGGNVSVDRREAVRLPWLLEPRLFRLPCSITTAGRVSCRRFPQGLVEPDPVEFDLCGT